MSLRDLLFPSPMFNAEDGAGGAATTDAAATTADAGPAAGGAAKGAEGQGDKAADAGADKGTDKAAATIAGGAADKDDAKVIHADFPEDWRQKWAGDDKDALKRLERYGSPADVFKAYRAMEQKLSSGEYKANKPFPESGSDDDKAAWRKEAGVPDKPEGYEIKLPDGIVLGEEDKPIIDSFKDFAHGKNWSPAQLNDAIGWYYAEQDRILVERNAEDLKTRQTNDDALRAEWGNDYRPNLNVYGSLMNEYFPGELRAAMESARLPDGTLLGDNVDFIKSFSKLARETFPTGTLLPANGDGVKSLSARKTEIEKMMGDQSSAYWQGPEAPKIQEEYRNLLNAEERMQGRNRAA